MTIKEMINKAQGSSDLGPKAIMVQHPVEDKTVHRKVFWKNGEPRVWIKRNQLVVKSFEIVLEKPFLVKFYLEFIK